VVDEIMLHVRVNAIADYYDIPQLRQLANTKIQHVLDTAWSADGFSGIIREVFQCNGDMELRKIMASTVAAHIEELIELDDFVGLDIPSDFVMNIIRHTISTYRVNENLSNQELQVVKAQLREAEYRLQSAKQEEASERSRSDRIIENIGNCCEILSEREVCRNARCDAEFACYIERGGFVGEPIYTVRCAKCRCRHKE
jgi:hypothetical protein